MIGSLLLDVEEREGKQKPRRVDAKRARFMYLEADVTHESERAIPIW